jgi:hypothetical protein
MQSYYDYNQEPKPIGIPVILGMMAGGVYILDLLVEYNDLSALMWSDLVTAVVLSFVVWCGFAIVERLFTHLINALHEGEAAAAGDLRRSARKPRIGGKENGSPLGSGKDLQVEPEGAAAKAAPGDLQLAQKDTGWIENFDNRFNEDRAYFGHGRTVEIDRNIYKDFEKVAIARWHNVEKFQHVSERTLHDIDIDRYNGSGKQLIELMFTNGLIRRDGQVYHWTEFGREVFPVYAPALLEIPGGGGGGGVVGEAPPLVVPRSTAYYLGEPVGE